MKANSDKSLAQLKEDFLLAQQVEGKTQDTLDFYRDNLGRFFWWLQHKGILLVLASLNVNLLRQFLAYVKTARQVK